MEIINESGTVIDLGTPSLRGISKRVFKSIKPAVWDEEKPSKYSLDRLVNLTFGYAPERINEYKKYLNKHLTSIVDRVDYKGKILIIGRSVSEKRHAVYNPSIFYYDKVKPSSFVRVFCTCPDYHYVWVFSNLRNKVSLRHNVPRMYVPVNEQTTKHSQGTAGICKHIYALGDIAR